MQCSFHCYLSQVLRCISSQNGPYEFDYSSEQLCPGCNDWGSMWINSSMSVNRTAGQTAKPRHWWDRNHYCGFTCDQYTVKHKWMAANTIGKQRCAIHTYKGTHTHTHERHCSEAPPNYTLIWFIFWWMKQLM